MSMTKAPKCRREWLLASDVYNLDELDFVTQKRVYSTDFPGGEKRLIQKPTGMSYIPVNGTVTFGENGCSSAPPGKVLRTCAMSG